MFFQLITATGKELVKKPSSPVGFIDFIGIIEEMMRISSSGKPGSPCSMTGKSPFKASEVIPDGTRIKVRLRALGVARMRGFAGKSP